MGQAPRTRRRSHPQSKGGDLRVKRINRLYPEQSIFKAGTEYGDQVRKSWIQSQAAEIDRLKAELELRDKVIAGPI